MSKRFFRVLVALSLTMGVTIPCYADEAVQPAPDNGVTTVQNVVAAGSADSAETAPEATEETQEAESSESVAMEPEVAVEAQETPADDKATSLTAVEEEAVSNESDLETQASSEGELQPMSSYLPMNTYAHGSISSNYESYSYRIEAPYNGSIKVYFGHTKTLSNNASVTVSLHRANGNSLGSTLAEKTVYGYSPSSISLTQIGVPAGSYFIQVSSSANGLGFGSYSVCPKYKASDRWETEKNDTQSEASFAWTNAMYYGSVDGFDKDYYHIQLKKTGTVQLKFYRNPRESGPIFDVSLISSNGSVFTSLEVPKNSSKTQYTLTTVGVPAGDYWVRINTNYDSPAGYYRFSVNTKASNRWEREFNDQKSTANRSWLNTKYYASFARSDWSEDDYFYFDVDQAGYYKLYLTHTPKTNGLSASYYLRDEGNYERMSGHLYSNSPSKISSGAWLQPGRYYLEMNESYDSASDTYAFSLVKS